MKVIVCIKQVPDTEAQIKVKDNDIDRENLNYVVNPYDEFAIEEALRIKEKFGGSVTLVGVGPERTREALKSGLALGADDAFHLWDDAFEGSDSLGTAKILKSFIAAREYDCVFAGKQGVDNDNAQVGPILADLLDLPHVSVITGLEIAEDGSKATAHREVEGGTMVIETSLPAVFTAQKGLNEPRYATLKGIMAVKKKTIETINAATLGIAPEEVGAKGAKIGFREINPPPERKPGQIIEGEPAEAAQKVVQLLREEAKVI